ncbi:MAG: hypothetical protein Q4D04_01150 [Clostridia bacterium]|nr:hypothetical protein [Clostridia bacterium]
MSKGWMKGAVTGAMLGASTAAIIMAMNSQARRKMTNVVSGAANTIADKASQCMK